MKNVIKAVLMTGLLAASANAVTINMDRGTATGMKVVNADGDTRVTSGMLIRWGTMSGEASTANFVQFATTTVTTTAEGGSTHGAIRTSIDIAGTAPTIAGQQVYMWIYDSATASATVNQGLFTSAGWVLPSTFSSDALASYNLTLGQNLNSGTPEAPVITAINIAGMADQASVRIGSVQNTAAGATNAGGVIYELGLAVPEPSTALLGALGVLGLLRRRRA